MVGPVGFEPTLVRLKGECFAHLASDPKVTRRALVRPMSLTLISYQGIIAAYPPGMTPYSQLRPQ